MFMKVLITGSTGMIGKGLLKECLAHEQVETILAINRNPIDISHPKLREALIKDFTDLTKLEKEVSAIDVCYF